MTGEDKKKYFSRMKRRFVRHFKDIYYSAPNEKEMMAFTDGYRAGFHGGVKSQTNSNEGE